MFQKLHLHLTALCAGITTAILLVMSLLYLYLSEKELYENQFRSFQNDISTIATALEQQSVISMEWLSKMEARGGYTFYILDNGIPFLYNQLSASPESSETHSLPDACLEYYRSEHGLSSIETDLMDSSAPHPYNTCIHTEFSFQPAGETAEYNVGIIEMDRQESSLQLLALSPLSFLREQITRQRTRFLLIDLAAILLLALFSFFFTGKLLRPVIESRKKQTEFVAAASHELRTPLAVILSAAECCRSALGEEQARFLDTIKQEGEILTSLVNDMLILSASDSHRFSCHPAPVELDTLVLSVYEAFDPLAAEKKLSLSVTLPEDPLPLCTADAGRIMQLLSILLHNALSYTPAGGDVALALSYQKKNFYLTVSDTGPGIPPEDRAKIFDRFYRAEKARSAKGHFGLGLSIAYEIVKLHHGTIFVSDRDGGGSVFTVMLP
ncbi:MAG: HAMP domain-containing histidine kinase [Bacteroidales bacterium]|nr:HAMP domain-containing histidine kinase [Bacteroidales bacterium]MCM1416028.1 HAMP domain-containing histidine kinase [bacterium]MCM1423839.1 HAMP domain-containing histidine kinase [bacterium]